MASIPKQKRILLRGQSKSGCFTCKSRKLKCDEQQPRCRRCVRAGYSCEGYPSRFDSSTPGSLPNSLGSVSTLIQATSKSQEISERNLDIQSQTSIKQLLITILCPKNVTFVGSNALLRVITEVRIILPSAIWALDALYTLTQCEGAAKVQGRQRLKVDAAYGEAVRMLREELCLQAHDTTSFFITSVILMSVELIQRRRQDALKHVLGSRQVAKSPLSINTTDAEVEYLWRIYDTQMMIYSRGVRFPCLGVVDATEMLRVDETVSSYQVLEKYVINILHYAHAFIATCHHELVVGHLNRTSDQERQDCLRYLSCAKHAITKQLDILDEIIPEHAPRMLLNLCVMTQIQMQQLTATDEFSWDNFADDFESIVTNAMISMTPIKVNSDDSRQYLRYTPQLGIIPPLALVALKYRNTKSRRRAISCLHRAGTEGPFVGCLLAAVAQKCVDIEESVYTSETNQAEAGTDNAKSTPVSNRVLRQYRLTKCSTVEDNGLAEGSLGPRTFAGTTKVMFVRQKRPHMAVEANILTSSSFTTDPRFRTLQHRTLDSEVWEVWTQQIHFGSILP